MPNVFAFSRRLRAVSQRIGHTPRHRRDGHFDNDNFWHDSEDQSVPAVTPTAH